MGDIFKEQLVTKKSDNRDRLKKLGIMVAAPIASMVAITVLNIFGLYFLTMPIAAGIVIGAIWFLGKQNKEYEYVLTNGEMDIDIIYNRNKRKKATSFNLRSVEIMTRIDDENHKSTFSRVTAVKDFSSGAINENTYQLLINDSNNHNVKLIIEPNEEMLKAMSTTIPRSKLFK